MTIQKKDAIIRLIGLIVITALVFGLFSCKAKKLAKSKERIEVKKDIIKSTEEDLKEVKTENTTSETETFVFEESDFILEIVPVGPFEITPSGEFKGEAESVKITGSKTVDQTIKEVKEQSDTTTTTETTTTNQQDKTEETVKKKDTHKQSEPSIKPYIGFAIAFSLLLLVAFIIWKIKDKLPF